MNEIASYKFRWMSFFCAIFVALIHLSATFADTTSEIILYYRQLAIPIMPYFLFSAAYFRYRQYDGSDYWTKLKRRVFTLLVPYVVWNTLEFVICCLTGYIEPSVLQYIKGLIFVYIPGLDIVHEPLIGALWYVIRLLSFEITAPLFYWLAKKKYVYVLAMLVLLLTIQIGNVNYYSYLYWMPFYLTGAFLAMHYKDKLENLLAVQPFEKHAFLRYVMTFLAAAVYGGYVYVAWKTGMNYTAERWLCIPMLILSMALISWCPKPRWIVEHGSFYLYCAHIPARFTIGTLLMGLEFVMGEIWFPQFYFLSIIVIIFISEWLLHLFCPKLLGILIGSR